MTLELLTPRIAANVEPVPLGFGTPPDMARLEVVPLLATQARQSMVTLDAVTYLLVDSESTEGVGDRIAGYFCLSAGEVRRADSPPGLAQRAPLSVPVIRMGRFAVDVAYQGQGWEAELLREALLRALRGAELLGARALLVDAISEQAAAFYRRFGFVPSPIRPRQLLKDLRVVRASAGLAERP